MELLSQFTGWQNYAAMELGQSEVLEAKAEAKVRYREAQAMVLRPLNEKVTVSRAVVTTDAFIEAARDEVLKIYAQRKLQQVIFANCERCVFVISRELSRRIGAAGAERRVQRWNP